MEKTNFNCGYVTLVGMPNVGKSTLMNNLLETKLSIVTPRPQTTRHRVLGILNEPDMQIIFHDTPGLMKPHYRLQDIMVKTVYQSVNDADVLLFMVDANDKKIPANIGFYNEIKKSGRPIVVAINKIDTIPHIKLLPMIEAYNEKMDVNDIVPISALQSDGLSELKKILKPYLPMNVPFYPPDYLTEQPERFFVAEIVREKIFRKYGEEIPYSTTVMIDEFKERENRKDFIRATIYVERDSQKGILIGKKGQALKAVGQAARHDIEKFIQRSVYLELHVSVRQKWRQNDNALRDFGYK